MASGRHRGSGAGAADVLPLPDVPGHSQLEATPDGMGIVTTVVHATVWFPPEAP
jgi:hypothetical protein